MMRGRNQTVLSAWEKEQRKLLDFEESGEDGD